MLKMYPYLLVYKDIQDWIREKSKLQSTIIVSVHMSNKSCKYVDRGVMGIIPNWTGRGKGLEAGVPCIPSGPFTVCGIFSPPLFSALPPWHPPGWPLFLDVPPSPSLPPCAESAVCLEFTAPTPRPGALSSSSLVGQLCMWFYSF